jgi:hypothetical protein
LLVSTKPGVIMFWVIVTVSSPYALVIVSVCEGLVVPTVTLPKLSTTGLASNSPVSLLVFANARLAFARPSSRRRAKLKIVDVKTDDFGRDMINPPENRAYVYGKRPPSLPAPKNPQAKLRIAPTLKIFRS